MLLQKWLLARYVRSNELSKLKYIVRRALVAVAVVERWPL